MCCVSERWCKLMLEGMPVTLLDALISLAQQVATMCSCRCLEALRAHLDWYVDSAARPKYATLKP